MNSGNGTRYLTQPHGSPAFASVAAQGYMAVSGDVVFVPGGRSLPAAFDRKSGKFLYFETRVGGYGVRVTKNLFSCGNVYNIEDIDEIAEDLEPEPY